MAGGGAILVLIVRSERVRHRLVAGQRQRRAGRLVLADRAFDLGSAGVAGVGEQGHRPARGGSAGGVPGDAGVVSAEPGLHADLRRRVRGAIAQPAAQLPWGHIMVLLDKVTEPAARQWYAAQVVEHGWSRAVLTITLRRTGTHGWVRHPTTSRPPWRAASRTWHGRSSRTPTTWTSWRLDPGYTERELEDALVVRMTHFFTELGDGFAFVGRQYRLPVET